MATLVVQQAIDHLTNQTEVSFVAADATNYFTNSSYPMNVQLWVWVQYPTGPTVTVKGKARDKDGNLVADLVLPTLAGNQLHILPTFSRFLYTDPASGLTEVQLSQTNGVTLAAVAFHRYV